MVAAVVPGSPLRADDGSYLPESPLLDSTVAIVFLTFAVPSIVYGTRLRVISESADIPRLLTAAVRDLASFVVLAALLNLFIISGSSQWTLMAIVFVPLFALLGFEPAFTQAAFRIGDSATQVITPLNPYMIVLLSFVRRYEPSAGLGTVMARMVPFVVPFMVVWTLILTALYRLGLPFGPGTTARIG